MLIRQCAGAIVFHKTQVLVLQNQKGEWVLPKGLLRDGVSPLDLVMNRAMIEGGVDAKVVAAAGETSYEFYSASRRCPIRNSIQWFILHAENDVSHPSLEDGYVDGGFYEVSEALQIITYTQDKDLVSSAYAIYKHVDEAFKLNT